MQKLTPFLWFDKEALEAAQFYTKIFPKSKITNTVLYPEGTPGKPGTIMCVEFNLHGLKFTAINGGPVYKFSGAISFVISCKSQKEVDHYWNALSKGGKEIQCGWLTDKYGITWQVVPSVLDKLMGSKNKKKANAATAAMMKMVKLDIAELKKAYNAA